jgi:hypothetical protein
VNLALPGEERVRGREVFPKLNASKFAAIRTNPGDGVAADSPLILLHATKADLEPAATGPTELLFLAAAVALIPLYEPFPPYF